MNTYMNTGMKKIISKIVSLVIAVAVIATALVGCRQNNQVSNKLTILDDGLLMSMDSIAYSYKQTNPNVEIELVKVDEDIDPKDFYQRLSTEIMAGDGPDILLVDNLLWRVLDGEKAARSGAFVDLNEFTKEDKEFPMDNLDKSIWEAGNFNGKQYLAPLSFTLPILFTTDVSLEKSSFDISKCNNLNTFVDYSIEYNRGNSNIPIFHPKTFKSYYQPLLVDLIDRAIDYDNKSIQIDTPEIKNYLELMKNIDINQNNSVNLNIPQYQNYLDSSTVFESFSSYFTLNSVLSDYKIAQSIDKKPIVTTLKNLNNGVTAMVDTSLVINNNCVNKEIAYDFLKFLLNNESFDMRNSRYYGAFPILKSSYAYNFNLCYGAESYTSFVGAGTSENGTLYTFSPYTQEEFSSIVSMIDEVSRCNRYISSAYMMFFEELTPYLNGEKSYEECMKQAQDKLEIYISE